MLKQTTFGGQGPKAYFIHGFAADSQSWIANVSSVTDRVEAIGIDLPGHGLSAQVALPDSLEDIASLVLDGIDTTRPCYFIGHSAGGAIAMLCAARAGAQALSLIAPVGLGQGINRQFVEQLPQVQSDEQCMELLQEMVVNKRLITKALAARVVAQLTDDAVRAQWQRFAEMLLQPSTALSAAVKHLHESGIETRIFWGDSDLINPYREADSEGSDGHWQVFDNCGHLPHIEQWSAYNSALSNLIEPRS